MEERFFHVFELTVQLIGLGYLIFKGGRYIGETNSMFKTLFKSQEEMKETQTAHQEDDDTKHEKIMDTLTNVQVSIAGMGHK